MSKGHTILEFTKAKFIGEQWIRQGSGIFYANDPKNNKNLLYVVWQGKTGLQITYEFFVPYNLPGTEIGIVYLEASNNIIIVPVDCTKQVRGDSTKCEG